MSEPWPTFSVSPADPAVRSIESRVEHRPVKWALSPERLLEWAGIDVSGPPAIERTDRSLAIAVDPSSPLAAELAAALQDGQLAMVELNVWGSRYERALWFCLDVPRALATGTFELECAGNYEVVHKNANPTTPPAASDAHLTAPA
jgi:hypothetical protein